MLPLATSPISEAMVAVMVLTGEKIDWIPFGITGAFPVTIITVMVSPITLPIPSMTAVMTPERAAGRVDFQMVCQGVAPKASEACR